MKCPKCGARYSKVNDSRPGNNERLPNGYIRRTRTCCHCGSRYTTIEVLVMETVISNNKASMDRAISEFCDSVSGYDKISNLRKAIKLWNAAQIIMSEGAKNETEIS